MADTIDEYAGEHGLRRIGTRPRLGNYIAEAWRRREFSWTMALLSRRSRHARTRLGVWWSVLLPLLQSMVYGLIFGVLLGSHRSPDFIPFLVTGVFLFTFVSGSFSAGALSISANAGLLRSINFPRIVLPVSAVVEQLLNLLGTLPILFVVALAFDLSVKVEFLLFPLVIALLALFGLGVALIASRLTVDVRDLSKLIPFVTRILFYVSGVVYNPERLGIDNPIIGGAMELNPVYAFLSLARGTLIAGYEVTIFHWIVAGSWTLVLLVLGTVYFWRAEERYGND